jgi:type 1 glutamine amidotransferase
MRSLLLLLFTLLPLAAQITYEGKSGPGKGKHIVFVASDHEYRTEETSPALARILAQHHGFKTTVCFGVDEDGFIKAGASDIKGLEALKDADLMVIFARFLDLPDEQMKHIADYIDRGGPVVGLRTSSHAFKIPAGKTYSHYDFQYKGEEFEKGFGHQILGNTWVGHYGKNHKQATRIQIIPAQKDNVILTGVADNALTMAGAYVGIPDDTFTVLTESQPLNGMTADSPVDEKKKPSPSTWTREYTSKSGTKGRVFHSTQGASQDLLDPNYRRLLINGIYWAAGMETDIKADSKVDFVGDYQPSSFSFGGEVKGVKPTDLADINSPIMPKKKASQ